MPRIVRAVTRPQGRRVREHAFYVPYAHQGAAGNVTTEDVVFGREWRNA